MGDKLSYPNIRMRRLRQNATLRNMLQDTRIQISDLIYPLFVHHNPQQRQAIASMPGQYQLGLEQLAEEITTLQNLGIQSVLLFGIPDYKDALGSESYASDSLISRAIEEIKAQAPEMLVISDVCFCEYTDHGHCGVFSDQDVDNDQTLDLLVKQALVHAKAGVDMIAPSGMMDGMIAALRQGLDEQGYQDIPIMSYSTKYSSSFYGPFREAAEGTPQLGDRKSYQMDWACSKQAMRETALDVAEGADILMVKPAMAYLDVIQRVKTQFPDMPLAAYQVSGEYAMLKAASQNGWLDEQASVMESLTAIKRAGADLIITYFAKDVANWAILSPLRI